MRHSSLCSFVFVTFLGGIFVFGKRSPNNTQVSNARCLQKVLSWVTFLALPGSIELLWAFGGCSVGGADCA